MREIPASDYVPHKPGDILSLRCFVISMRNLQHPFSETPEPYPTQEFLRQAWKDVSQAYGKRTIIHTPEGNLEGILEPVREIPIGGIHFTHYQGSQPATHLYSPEDLELQKSPQESSQAYEFLVEKVAGCMPLYGWESLEARFMLWKAGVKPKK